MPVAVSCWVSDILVSNDVHFTEAAAKGRHEAVMFLFSQVTITDLLRVHMFTVHKETDAAVLHDASTVEDQHQVVPLSFLCQLWTPEPHSVVAQSWVLFKLTSVTCTNGNGSGNTNPDSTDIIIIIYSLTPRVVGAPQMISRPVF